MKTSIAFTLAAAAFSLVAAQSANPGPSPTESYGCEPHGDHWHCVGPVTVTTAPTLTPVAPNTSAVITSTTTPDHGNDDHTDHPASTGASMKPSPTESIGCEPHADHWHCARPRETTAASDVITSAPGTITSTRTGTTSAPASTLGTTPVAAGNGTRTGTQSPVFTGAASARNAGLCLVGGLLILPFAL